MMLALTVIILSQDISDFLVQCSLRVLLLVSPSYVIHRGRPPLLKLKEVFTKVIIHALKIRILRRIFGIILLHFFLHPLEICLSSDIALKHLLFFCR